MKVYDYCILLVPGKFKKEIVFVPKKEENNRKKDEKISRLIHNKILAEQDLFRAKRIEIELQNKLGMVTVKRHPKEDPMLCGEYAEDIYQYILKQQVRIIIILLYYATSLLVLLYVTSLLIYTMTSVCIIIFSFVICLYTN